MLFSSFFFIFFIHHISSEFCKNQLFEVTLSIFDKATLHFCEKKAIPVLKNETCL